MKRTLILLSIIIITFCSGCSYTNYGVEGLLTTPMFSEEQAEIYQCLIDSVGNNINPIHPLSGNDRNAFCICNVDNEPTEEAIVFYEKTNQSQDQGSIRINILDKIDGKWTSIYDIAGDGNNVDKIIVTKLGDDKLPSIIIGFSYISAIENKLCIYKYEDQKLAPKFNRSYTIFDVMDFDSDFQNELITITSASATSIAKAEIYENISSQTMCTNSVALKDTTSKYVSMKQGNYKDNKSAIFIDEITNEGKCETEVLVYQYNTIMNPLNTNNNDMSTARPDGYYCMDADGDDKIEIPVTVPFITKDEYSSDEQILITEWYIYENYGRLTKKMSSYYSIVNDYVYIMPSRWTGLITARRDPESEDIIFCSLDEIDEPDKFILKFNVVDHSKLDDYLSKNYKVIDSKGQIDYIYKLGNTENTTLIPTESEIEVGFNVFE